MPAAPEGLRAQQLALAHWIRDPSTHAPPPGIEARRLNIYRQLFRNNLDGLLSSQFPVIRRLRGAAAWAELVDGFLREHHARTPLFPELGQEFIAYLQTRAAASRGDPGFLPELAHYEWAELAIALAPADAPSMEIDPHGDLIEGRPVLSTLAWPLAYVWPVDRIRPEFQPAEAPAEPSLFLLQRRPDFGVKFAKIDPMAYALLQQLREAPARGREIVQRLAQLAGVEAETLIEPARGLMEGLRGRGVILGVG
jgi:hypothetical protein